MVPIFFSWFDLGLWTRAIWRRWSGRSSRPIGKKWERRLSIFFCGYFLVLGFLVFWTAISLRQAFCDQDIFFSCREGGQGMERQLGDVAALHLPVSLSQEMKHTKATLSDREDALSILTIRISKGSYKLGLVCILDGSIQNEQSMFNCASILLLCHWASRCNL